MSGLSPMRMELLNPFISAGINVLGSEAGFGKLVPGKATLIQADSTHHALNLVVGVVGSVRGLVVYGLDLMIAKRIVKTMVGERLPMSDPIAISAMGELGNLISGTAAQDLEEAGFSCRLSPPRLVLGTGVRLAPKIVSMLAVPIATEIGECKIYLAVLQRHRAANA